MRILLTSSLGGYSRVNGTRVPEPLPQKNGFLDRLRSMWPASARVLFLCGEPADHKKNDNICGCFRESLPMSGLSVSAVDMCDDRDPDAVRALDNIDVLILTGGHVPTQNRFFKTLRLRERLAGYQGLLIAWSAGSMNCADRVYAGPELEGEAVDPHYARWLTGLGLTDINIFPHMQALRDTWLDGMRLMEDITYPDSMGHPLLALNDGSYLVIDGGRTTLYGEAYRILDGREPQLCQDGSSLVL